jgi:predicted nicotinamide N-methyase
MGSGTGLVGMTAAKCGWHIMMTDKNENILTRLRETAILNQVTISTRVLKWGSLLDESEHVDLILLADCFYDSSGS